jgi:hypothetical protein
MSPLEAGLAAADLADEVHADHGRAIEDLEDAAGQQGQDIAAIRRDVRELRGELAAALDLRTAVTWIAELEELARGLRERLGLAERRIAVLDRLRPTCASCHDDAADRLTTRGPLCTGCAGDLPGAADGGAWPA